MRKVYLIWFRYSNGETCLGAVATSRKKADKLKAEIQSAAYTTSQYWFTCYDTEVRLDDILEMP